MRIRLLEERFMSGHDKTSAEERLAKRMCTAKVEAPELLEKIIWARITAAGSPEAAGVSVTSKTHMLPVPHCDRK